MQKRIYFDYAASTPVDRDVYAAMKSYFGEHFGNPGSLHSFGQEAMAAVDLSRELVASALGAQFRDIIFTGSATEANNLALRGAVRRFMQITSGSAQKKFSDNQLVISDAPRIIISVSEHESILETARDLEREGIVEVIYIPVNKEGTVDLKKLREALNERTVLVSIMYVNNEIGTVQPIAEIAKIIRNFRERSMVNGQWSNVYPLFHVDAVQAFQFFDCNPATLGVDLMTLSAHKIYGPKGVGALYMGSRVQGVGSSGRKFLNPSGYTLAPIITGGGQEFGLRSGTENTPLIVGFGVAVSHAAQYREERRKYISGLKKYFFQKLRAAKVRYIMNGPREARAAPNIAHLYFPGKRIADLTTALDLKGFAVSQGSACKTRSSQISYVLHAIKLAPLRARASLRISFGAPTTKQEIDALIGALKKIK